MKVANKTVVSLTYTLKVDNGDVVDQTKDEAPFVFIHGIGQTLPEFDNNLAGLQKDEEFSFSLSATDGYGEHKEEMVVPLERKIFDVPNAPEGMLNLGNTIPMQDRDGNMLYGKVLSASDTEVVLDFNHPLAGETLNFTGKILNVREASESELEHGHVHGEGGVQH